eukprot:SAG22_NODE_10084_length_554_cov_0.626374_1_plen_140_part_10
MSDTDDDEDDEDDAEVAEGETGARELQRALVERISASSDASALGRLKIGMATKEFSKPDRTFKDRTWAFTNLAARTTSEFVTACLPGDDGGWWHNWLLSMAGCAAVQKSGASALSLEEPALKMALFDGFLRLAVRCVLQ